MPKMILSLLILMVLMLACVMPAFACDGCSINESGTYLHAQIDQADLVDDLAVVVYLNSGALLTSHAPDMAASHNLNQYNATVSRSSEVLPLSYTEWPDVFVPSNKMKTAGTLLVATYNPGHDQFDYGEFTLLPQLE